MRLMAWTVSYTHLDVYKRQEGEWFIDDARKADPKTMPEFDLLCGGFPCQADVYKRQVYI